MQRFDGVICFGGADWWYHNRGHYDIQMCREFARHVPVLYVNSLGVRLPAINEGSMFVRRVTRKLRSWSRNFVQIDKHFGVVSPISVPGRIGRRLSGPILHVQLRRAARRMGIANPLLWVECPAAASVIDGMSAAALIYQRTDRYEEFPGVDLEAIKALDRQLKGKADLTLFCSSHLFAKEGESCRRARFVDHGVDFERFAAAGLGECAEPDDVNAIPRPRVGFVGGIDSHTFDANFFVGVARQLPTMSLVLVGQCSLQAGWCGESNVHLLGKKPYESVAEYMAACDVLIMPWNRNEWIKACNPVKLKEYLAVGRPVVSTPFEELKRYAEVVRTAETTDAFATAISECISDPGAADVRRERVRNETWSAKAATVIGELAAVQIEPSIASEAHTARRALSTTPARATAVGE